ncbi:hypothetical protein OQA88_7451 [Cercophora sp. LCS_1]
MKVSTVLAALSLALIAVATPVDTDAVLKDKKYEIQWCKKESYHDCTTYDDCYTKKCYDHGDGYNNKAESVRHSKSVDCYYFDKKDCKGDYLHASGNYEELPKKWKDEISSWYCEDEDDHH